MLQERVFGGKKMNYVQPIRDLNKIDEMKSELKKNGTRDYLLFLFGINIGLRISDIIKLRVRDVVNADMSIKTHITIIEEKTNKVKVFKINSTLTDELKQYVQHMQPDEYMFKSRKGTNRPISRVQAYRILTDTANKIGLTDVGTHSLRKTFGYHFYQKTKDIVLLQQLFNHSSPSITRRYIGISQDEIDIAYENFVL